MELTERFGDMQVDLGVIQERLGNLTEIVASLEETREECVAIKTQVEANIETLGEIRADISQMKETLTVLKTVNSIAEEWSGAGLKTKLKVAGGGGVFFLIIDLLSRVGYEKILELAKVIFK